MLQACPAAATATARRNYMHRSFKSLPAALAIAACFAFTASASAGQCPAGKAGTDTQKDLMTEPKKVTDKVLGMADLSTNIGIEDRALRLRRLEIQAGGVVPWHNHDDRPAVIHIVQGTILEYSSLCTVPIVHKAGDTVTEEKGVSHWWRNESKKPVVLFSADVLHGANDATM
jgi:quercetin dioxygenase-like cupin family protein